MASGGIQWHMLLGVHRSEENFHAPTQELNTSLFSLFTNFSPHQFLYTQEPSLTGDKDEHKHL